MLMIHTHLHFNSSSAQLYQEWCVATLWTQHAENRKCRDTWELGRERHGADCLEAPGETKCTLILIFLSPAPALCSVHWMIRLLCYKRPPLLQLSTLSIKYPHVQLLTFHPETKNLGWSRSVKKKKQTLQINPRKLKSPGWYSSSRRKLN